MIKKKTEKVIIITKARVIRETEETNNGITACGEKEMKQKKKIIRNKDISINSYLLYPFFRSFFS